MDTLSGYIGDLIIIDPDGYIIRLYWRPHYYRPRRIHYQATLETSSSISLTQTDTLSGYTGDIFIIDPDGYIIRLFWRPLHDKP